MLEQDKIYWDNAVKAQLCLNVKKGDRKSYLGGEWDSYGEHITDYDRSFKALLKGKPIRSLIEKRPFPVVLDIMAPSTTIATLFNYFPDKPKFGLAVSLEDRRSFRRKKYDDKRNIQQIGGDILLPSTWDKVGDRLAGFKSHLVMQRALGGYQCIPFDPRLYGVFLSKAWGFLSPDNGIILAGIPSGLEKDAKRAIDNFRMNNIEADMHDGGISRYSTMMLVKTPNSPEKLPFA
jgi:hypothetical protein